MTPSRQNKASTNPAEVPSLETSQAPEQEVSKYLEPSWHLHWVRTPEQLEKLGVKLDQLKDKLGEDAIFSVDTETGGVGNEPLHARLSLIQIGIPHHRNGTIIEGKGTTYLVDVKLLTDLAAKEGRDEHKILDPLANSLSDPEIKKVAHHAQFERDQFEKYGIAMQGYDDTLRMTKLLRPDMYSYTLAACVKEVMGQDVLKDEQTGLWLDRPLTESQIRYAALDAEATLNLHTALKKLLEENDLTQKHPVDLHGAELLEEWVNSATDAPGILRKADPTAQLANELALLEAKVSIAAEHGKNLLHQAWKQRAEDDPDFDPEKPIRFETMYGTGHIGTQSVTELDLEQLQLLHPQLAEDLVHWSASKSAIEKAIKEQEAAFLEASNGELKKKDLVAIRKADLEFIFPISGSGSPRLSTFEPNLDSVYGEKHQEIETIANMLGLDASAENTSASLTAISELAARLRPDLPSHSIPACCVEIIGVELEAIPAELAAGKQKDLIEKNRASVRSLNEKLEEMSEELSRFEKGIATTTTEDMDSLLEGMVENAGRRLDLLRMHKIGNEYGPALARRDLAKERLRSWAEHEIAHTRQYEEVAVAFGLACQSLEEASNATQRKEARENLKSLARDNAHQIPELNDLETATAKKMTKRFLGSIEEHMRLALKHRYEEGLSASGYKAETEFGNIRVSIPTQREYDHEALLERRPELKHLAQQGVSQQEVRTYWTEKGIPNTEQDEMIYDLWVEVGRSAPRAKMFPANGSRYGGEPLPEELPPEETKIRHRKKKK